jgi:hypothetical protein
MSLHVKPLTSEGKIRVETILQQAAKDIKFRELLTENPKEALKNSGLTEEEISVISTMRRVALEEWGIDVRPFRGFLRDNGFKITEIMKLEEIA